MAELCRRFDNNPLVTPADVKPSRDDFFVTGVLNAGAFEFDGKYCWMVRVAEAPIQDDPDVVKVPLMNMQADPPEMGFKCFRKDDPECDFSDTRIVKRPGQWYITNISYLRMATSEDGKTWTVSDENLITPMDKYEQFGVEDPRITKIDDEYLLTYSAISRHGVTSNLIITKDWKTFDRKGVLYVPDNKDICIYPEKVNGMYVAMHRPSVSMLGKPEIWQATSPDLIHWGNHECIMEIRPGKWDGCRIGCGPAPIKTPEGWLEIYHGSDDTNYYLGAALLDLDDPFKVLARSEAPILTPEESYEKEGFFANVVFANGQIVHDDGRIWIYYGGADMIMAGCETTVDELLASLK